MLKVTVIFTILPALGDAVLQFQQFWHQCETPLKQLSLEGSICFMKTNVPRTRGIYQAFMAVQAPSGGKKRLPHRSQRQAMQVNKSNIQNTALHRDTSLSSCSFVFTCHFKNKNLNVMYGGLSQL